MTAKTYGEKYYDHKNARVIFDRIKVQDRGRSFDDNTQHLSTRMPLESPDPVEILSRKTFEPSQIVEEETLTALLPLHFHNSSLSSLFISSWAFHLLFFLSFFADFFLLHFSTISSPQLFFSHHLFPPFFLLILFFPFP